MDGAAKLLLCSMCMRYITDPRILPCFHTFCFKCLLPKIKKDNSLSCPDCSSTSQVTVRGTNDFRIRKNEFVESLIRNMKCHTCPEPKPFAVKKCIDCDQLYCLKCSDMHLKFSVTQHHKTIELDGFLSVTKCTFDVCQTHQEEVRIYCEECKSYVCLLCYNRDHNAHKMVLVSEQFESFKGKLYVTLETKKNLRKKIRAQLQYIELKLDESLSLAEDTKSEIFNHCESLKAVIDRQFQELSSIVNSKLKNYTEPKNELLSKVKAKEEYISKEIVECENALNNLNFETLRECRGSLKDIVSDASDEVIVPELDCNFNLKFEPNPNTVQTIKSIEIGNLTEGKERCSKEVTIKAKPKIRWW